MTFFHGTSKENWRTIQEEGVLWGRRYVVDDNGHPVKEVSRCTYLALERKVAEQYGEVVLEVEYNPFNMKGNIRRDRRGPLNNYSPDSWQLRVYEPISIENIKTS
jgi:hypothetical protein